MQRHRAVRPESNTWPMSAERDGPVTMLMVRGSSPRARQAAQKSSNPPQRSASRSTTKCVSPRKVSVTGLSGPEARNRVPVASASPQSLRQAAQPVAGCLDTPPTTPSEESRISPPPRAPANRSGSAPKAHRVLQSWAVTGSPASAFGSSETPETRAQTVARRRRSRLRHELRQPRRAHGSLPAARHPRPAGCSARRSATAASPPGPRRRPAPPLTRRPRMRSPCRSPASPPSTPVRSRRCAAAPPPPRRACPPGWRRTSPRSAYPCGPGQHEPTLIAVSPASWHGEHVALRLALEAHARARSSKTIACSALSRRQTMSGATGRLASGP